jgi:hypothetical protein
VSRLLPSLIVLVEAAAKRLHMPALCMLNVLAPVVGRGLAPIGAACGVGEGGAAANSSVAAVSCSQEDCAEVLTNTMHKMQLVRLLINNGKVGTSC